MKELLGRYCSLSEAAQFLDVSVERIIHLGSISGIHVFVIPDPDWKFKFIDHPYYVYNDPSSLRSLENYALFTVASLDAREHFGSRESAKWMIQTDLQELLLPIHRTDLRAIERGEDPEFLLSICPSPDGIGSRLYVSQEETPIRLSECKLYVSTDSLNKFEKLLAAEAIAVGNENTFSEPAEGLAVDSRESQKDYSVKHSTLLKMVLAMAVVGYRFDPDKKKNEAIGDIVKDSQRLGLSIGEDTVRKILKDAVEIHGKPSKH